MAKYEIEVSFTRNGEAHSVHGAVHSPSYLQALAAVNDKFGAELESQGLDGSGSLTVHIWTVDSPKVSTEVDNMPQGA